MNSNLHTHTDLKIIKVLPYFMCVINYMLILQIIRDAVRENGCCVLELALAGA